MNTLFFIISLFVANPNLDEEYTPYDLYEGITTCISIYLVYKFISSIYEESKNKISGCALCCCVCCSNCLLNFL